MLSDVVDRLACPHCGGGLDLSAPDLSAPDLSAPDLSAPDLSAPDLSAGRVLLCDRGHSFDVARQGYVSLLPGSGRAAGGDTAEMVAARRAFLDTGHYDVLAAAVAAEVARAAQRCPVECVLDVGAGTGYYLAAALTAAPGAVGVAVDASRAAARIAAAHPRVGSVVADTWLQLPLAEAAVSVALTVFAPRRPSELRRVLGPAGTLVVVTPTPRHLGELVGALGLLQVDERKPERLDDAMTGTFVRGRHVVVEASMHLSHPEVELLVGMGPSAWHTSTASRAEAIAALPDTVPVTTSVQVSTYRPVP